MTDEQVADTLLQKIEECLFDRHGSKCKCNKIIMDFIRTKERETRADERERCAKVAETFPEIKDYDSISTIFSEVAKAIRQLK